MGQLTLSEMLKAEAPSSRHDLTSRDKLDRYYSAPYWLDLLFAREEMSGALERTSSVLEPFAGQDLALADRARQLGYDVTTADVDTGAPVEIHGDSFSLDFGEYDATISNPPFSVRTDAGKRTIVDAVKKFTRVSTQFTAMIGRLSLLEPCDDRGDFLAATPPALVLVLPRYSFRGGGKDMMTCAWFVWIADHTGPSNLAVVSKKQAAAAEYNWRLERRKHRGEP